MILASVYDFGRDANGDLPTLAGRGWQLHVLIEQERT